MIASLRALPTALRVGFAGAVAYRVEFLIWMLTTNTPLIMLLLWSAVAQDAPVGSFGQAEFGAYFLAALVVRLLTGNWVVWELAYEIRQGSLAQKLLRPMHPLTYYATEALAALPLRVGFSLPIGMIALAWLGTEVWSSDPLSWIVAALAIVGAWWITYFIMAAIGSLSFLWDSTMSLVHLWYALFMVFSGYILPLSLFPPWLYGVVEWLPFRYLLSFPVEAMLGMLDRQEMLHALAVQWAYLVVSFLTAAGVWRLGLRRWEAYGG